MKKMLQSGKIPIGTMVSAFDTPQILRMIAGAGLDWAFLDTESANPDPARLEAMLSTAQLLGLPAIVRVPEIRKTEIGRVLDLGAAGVICPDVRTPEEAREAVRLTRYFPEGERGVALDRPHTGLRLSGTEEKRAFMARANERVILICQIETPQGVEHVEEIAAVPGVDGLLIGPNDLSQSMGIYGQTEHPAFLSAVDRTLRAAERRGKYVGMSCGSIAACRKWAARGARFFQVGTDASLYMAALRAMEEQRRAWRREQEGQP